MQNLQKSVLFCMSPLQSQMVGLSGVSFVVLLATVGLVGILMEVLAFIADIDRILDMARTVVHVVGISLATVIISK